LFVLLLHGLLNDPHNTSQAVFG